MVDGGSCDGGCWWMVDHVTVDNDGGREHTRR